MAQYTAIQGTVDADRYFRGNNPWGFTENADTDTYGPDHPVYTLTVPHADGDLPAAEGDYVLTLDGPVYAVCPAALFPALFTVT